MVEPYGMGRFPSLPDVRNKSIDQMKILVDLGLAEPIDWDVPFHGNQEQTPHCGGFAAIAFLSAAQKDAPATTTYTDEDGHKAYYEIVAMAGRPNTEYGCSIHEVAKWLKSIGAIGAYGFGSAAQADSWLESYGSIIYGTNWYSGMYYPSSDGMLQITGEIVGGHAYLGQGSNTPKPYTKKLHNSWDGWGINGDAYISDENNTRLVDRENGEALCCVKIVKPIPVNAEAPWPDLSEQYWAAGWRLKLSGLFLGKDDGTFGPDDDISGSQLALVFYRLTQRQVVKRLDMLLMLDWFLSKGA